MSGKHLLLDCYGVTDLTKLNSMSFIYDFLLSIPSLVNLDPLGLPHVVKATDISADGITGFQLLTTSHASCHTSCHTWTTGNKTGEINIDVFSCDDFDEQKVICEVEDIFNPAQMESKVIRR